MFPGYGRHTIGSAGPGGAGETVKGRLAVGSKARLSEQDACNACCLQMPPS